MLLSLGGIHRFETPCVSLLRQCVVDDVKLARSCAHASWLKTQVWDRVAHGRDTLPAFDVLLRTVTHSGAGWDLVTQTFMQVGLSLLQSAKPRDLPLPCLPDRYGDDGTYPLCASVAPTRSLRRCGQRSLHHWLTSPSTPRHRSWHLLAETFSLASLTRTRYVGA